MVKPIRFWAGKWPERPIGVWLTTHWGDVRHRGAATMMYVIGRILSCFFVLSLFSASSSEARVEVAGAVYSLTNAANGNQVKVFHRLADGRLRNGGLFDTG